ncbi:hypothetical protein [Thermogemmatispora sp.]
MSDGAGGGAPGAAPHEGVRSGVGERYGVTHLAGPGAARGRERAAS